MLIPEDGYKHATHTKSPTDGGYALSEKIKEPRTKHGKSENDVTVQNS
jgi:hypothetical protein